MIGLFISTLTEQPIAATVATAMVSTLLWILDAVPQLDWLHPWLLVDRWMAFVDLLRDPPFTDRMVTGLWVDAAYAAVFLLLAWLRLRQQGHHQLTPRPYIPANAGIPDGTPPTADHMSSGRARRRLVSPR